MATRWARRSSTAGAPGGPGNHTVARHGHTGLANSSLSHSTALLLAVPKPCARHTGTRHVPPAGGARSRSDLWLLCEFGAGRLVPCGLACPAAHHESMLRGTTRGRRAPLCLAPSRLVVSHAARTRHFTFPPPCSLPDHPSYGRRYSIALVATRKECASASARRHQGGSSPVWWLTYCHKKRPAYSLSDRSSTDWTFRIRPPDQYAACLPKSTISTQHSSSASNPFNESLSFCLCLFLKVSTSPFSTVSYFITSCYPLIMLHMYTFSVKVYNFSTVPYFSILCLTNYK
jgi:hypothetical protein